MSERDLNMEGKHATRNSAEASTMKLGDIYYIVFRRKWLIALFLAAGVGAAVALYLMQRPKYWSEAKLLVRYVVDNKYVQAGTGATTKSPDSQGDMIINSEMEILTSLDLCEEVAAVVGPQRLLGNKGSNLTAAAAVVSSGLTVDNPRRSNIIRVQFSHTDPSVCQIVLLQLIESYFRRHKDIHLAASAVDDVLTQQADHLLGRIRQSDDELRRLKAQAGVISVDDTKKDLSDQIAKGREEIFKAESEIAELEAMLAGKDPTPIKNEKEAHQIGAPAEKVAEYRFLHTLLDTMRKKEMELLTVSQFTDEHPQVKLVRQQLAENEMRKKALETEFPKLTQLFITHPIVVPQDAFERRPDPLRISGLQSRIKAVSNQLAQVRAEFAKLDGLESSIRDVERRLQVDQEEYMRVVQGIRGAKIQDILVAGKMTNIQPVQNPSPPAANTSQRVKRVVVAFFGLLFAGFGLAFVLEIFVDRTIRRPGDFEAKAQLPLFLSIPKLSLNGHAKMLPFPGASTSNSETAAAVGLHNTWDVDHPLRDYIQGLRDRILIHFEGDPHKPKLIGITSCRKDAGVTSLAAGLAGALSETGDGNVLLLNLNCDAQAVHPFYRGELTCDISDAFESERRDSGKVLENLYVATAGNPADPMSQNLPKQLARVVPKLRVSDYDYIVFDLPPTTPTTMTARLASMMDLVILVVESEKDTQETVKQAGKLLSRSKARVSAVLNKVRNPVPRWLHNSP